jgi:Family of unknown function (DUF6288)
MRNSPGITVPLLFALTIAATATVGIAQVHYHKNGRPWNQRARGGPDAEVPGWYYNLGITGMRAQLVADKPKSLLIKHVFAGTPAHRKIQVDDYITGIGGKRFEHAHKNGYGMERFGADGPMLEFATALEACMSPKRKGKLRLSVLRGDKQIEIELRVSTKYGQFSPTFPAQCKKSDRIRAELYEYLARHQRDDGSWGSAPHNTFAPLALLASGKKRYLPLVEKNVRMHARTTKAKDHSSLINWRYMAAAIVMSEYYLATRQKWLRPELQQVYEFLLSSQYTDMSQINPKARETHPHAVPKNELNAHGGWGHNPGFEGYGPICMLSGQGALAFAMMHRCGIQIDRERHDFAYEFVARGTGANGYVWYADKPAGRSNWADMGRTGAAGLANFLSPYTEKKYRQHAMSHATVIGEHPQSFPDTHGSPVMGMGYAAAAANFDKGSWRKLMDANKWWFVLAQCCDGSFYYQPNRDNAGYGNDSRVSATAVTAFIFSLHQRNLYLSGKSKR